MSKWYRNATAAVHIVQGSFVYQVSTFKLRLSTFKLRLSSFKLWFSSHTSVQGGEQRRKVRFSKWAVPCEVRSKFSLEVSRITLWFKGIDRSVQCKIMIKVVRLNYRLIARVISGVFKVQGTTKLSEGEVNGCLQNAPPLCSLLNTPIDFCSTNRGDYFDYMQ